MHWINYCFTIIFSVKNLLTALWERGKEMEYSKKSLLQPMVAEVGWYYYKTGENSSDSAFIFREEQCDFL